MEHAIIWKIAGSGLGIRNTAKELVAAGQEDINPPLYLFICEPGTLPARAIDRPTIQLQVHQGLSHAPRAVFTNVLHEAPTSQTLLTRGPSLGWISESFRQNFNHS